MTLVLNRSTRSARKPKGGGHERRGEILAAATRIFNSDGYDGATIRRIADEVGLSSTALYMHFRDKDEILVEICQGAMEQLLTLAAQIAAQEKPAADRARDMIEAYIRFGLDNPSTYRLVFCSHGRHLSPESQAPVEMLGDRCFQKLHNVVAEIADQGRLKSPGAQVATQVLWSAGHGLVSLMITQPDRQWAPAPVLTTALLDGIFDGVLRA